MANDVKPPVCLTIAGLDPSGGAGILADVKAFSAFGCFGAAAVSSVTFQNTLGVFGAVHQSAASVRKQVDPVFDDFDVAAVKTGMLPTRGVIETVATILRKRKPQNLVVDPVVRSTSGFDLIDEKALQALIEQLFPLATIVTPNLPEAERITKLSIKSVDDIKMAARRIHSFGPRYVLIKGGHFQGDKAVDHLFDGEAFETFEADYIETTATHGTGCILAASIAANLALGEPLLDAVRTAKMFVHEAIRASPGLGHGNSPINI
jgi:hydroxymethylpyrimidine/phosphomethylpyrimidine kinase